MERKCDAVFIYPEGYDFFCIKFTEIRADLIETLPGDSVRALKDDDRRYRDIDIPSRLVNILCCIMVHSLIDLQGIFATKQSMEFDSDGVIMDLGNGTFECIKYNEVKD